MSIRELRSVIEAMSHCDDENRYELLFNMAKILISNGDGGDAELIWLKTKLPVFGDNISLSEEMEKLLVDMLFQSSEGGCREAQYEYGCMLYEKNNLVEAYRLYEKSANQGYPPAQWLFGYSLLKSDFEKGKLYIVLSAGQNYEYAIDFLIDSYENGKNGFDINEDEFKKWIFVKSYNLKYLN
ncbi:tetratricopeptide repeat protein [Cellvibrio sp. PSBB006]|uniref:tetratricopeptide repeat protein n=1 Tax=Cellvibrio sp. PSBB006 TaxID=1987723 RepID=UPI000B3B50D3|nr:hypothetical protein [Cellvibrio sp. PSBB006]ARU27414.1 hypothetical protein CBR65_08150 [Cellvibrio sp. PSBB006]